MELIFGIQSPYLWTLATLSLSLCENNKQFGFILVSRRFDKRVLVEEQNKLNKEKLKTEN